MTSIQRLSRQIMNQYDRNNDGAIQLGRHRNNEASRIQRDHQSGYDYDIVTVTKYSHDQLFRAADRNHDNRVTQRELEQVMRTFDRNRDGKLENQGPFWDRKGELQNFNRAYQERSEVIDRDFIRKPRPYPGHGNGWPTHPGHGHGNKPGWPNKPGQGHGGHKPDWPGKPHHPGQGHNHPHQPGQGHGVGKPGQGRPVGRISISDGNISFGVRIGGKR